MIKSVISIFIMVSAIVLMGGCAGLSENPSSDKHINNGNLPVAVGSALAPSTGSELQKRYDELVSNPAPLPAVTYVSEEQLEDWTSFARERVTDPSTLRLSFGISGAENTVRVISEINPGGPESCSGVLIDRKTVLTAAHCVCGRPSDTMIYNAEQCKGTLAQTSAEVFSYKYGLSEEATSIHVHPDYEFRNSNNDPAKASLPGEQVADLAIVKIKGFAGVRGLGITDVRGQTRFATSAFGRFSWTTALEHISYVQAKEIYKAGIQQMSFWDASDVHNGSVCIDGGQYGPDDGICTEHKTGSASIGAPSSTSGVCGGDSGSPLYSVGSDGQLELVGIASYFYPPASGGVDCQTSGEADIVNVYISVSDHREWVESFLEPSELSTTVSDSNCKEFMFSGPGEIINMNDNNRVSVSAINEGYNEDPPLFQIQLVGQHQCRADLSRGVSSCDAEVAAPSAIRAFDSGLYQAFFCKYN